MAGPRLFLADGNGHYRLEQRFKAYEGEKLYGLGQHLHGRFDQKGLVMDLVQRNAEVSVPFMVSSRGLRVPLELARCWARGAGRQRDTLGRR